MSIYLYLIGLYFLCIISSSVCNICSECSCSTTLDEEPIINCHEKNLDMLNFDLLMLNEDRTFNKLILSKNNILILPEDSLKKLKLLKSLDLSDNVMENIDTRTFIHLNNLEDLNLSNNSITTFDDSLLKVLPVLLTLNLSYNHINIIEHGIGEAVTKINFLDISHNNISNLPNNFFDSLPNLNYLDLSFNKIYSLTNTSLMYLNSLKVVYITNNFLTALYMQTLPKSLVELHIGYNLISEIFYEPNKIEVLNIEYNHILEIQPHLLMLKNLQHLNVSGNMLSNFPNISLENLKTLDISCNKLLYIPKTLSIENFPLLNQLNVSKNPLQNLKFHSDLKLHSFVASNISMMETIDKDTFSKLRAPSKGCINLTISNNEMLSSIHEEALEHLNLCSLDLSNNQFTYIAQKLVLRNTSFITYNLNLQGNPFKCNCSLQWILSDIVPKLYSTQPNLLDNLRCAWPPEIANMRMVHWYKWNDQIFCTNMSDFNEELKINVTGVLSSNEMVTFDSSPGLLIVLGTAIAVLSILIIVGFIWTQRVYIKRRRINRKF